MALPLPNINVTLENDDLGQVFKDKINALITALNENRTEFNSQLAAELTASQHADAAAQEVVLAKAEVAIALQWKEDAEAAAIAANNTVAGTHTHQINGVTGLQTELNTLQTNIDTAEIELAANINRAKRLALAGI